MSLPNPWSSYRQVATQTATPGQLVLMLFDGAIRFLERARLGFAETDPLAFNLTVNNNLQRAQAIIHELNTSLNLRDGGEVAANFQRLYDYMDERLQESNFQKSDAGIADVLRRLGVLREAWAEMLRRRGEDLGQAAPGLAFASHA
ncbi:MAG: flagellar protein FliS [Limisphaerales bacterium]|nr:MAG: flagellar protein FliS [Limisphaerales bacterium]KAG0506955.1 MAG: flagellar protein FliS [Limisphaerales bacterium]TXT49195.1 MAG: flagellar protein FliS [Limisphaerales bacterium]